MNAKKPIKQGVERRDGRIILDAKSFGVAWMVGVGWMIVGSTRVADFRIDHARLGAEELFHAPKAATGEDEGFGHS